MFPIPRLRTPLYIKKGDTLILDIEWVDSNEEPIDLEGVNIKLVVRLWEQMEPLLTLSTTNNEITTEGNKISIRGSSIKTMGMPSCDALVDIQATYPNEDVHTIVQGDCVISDGLHPLL